MANDEMTKSGAARAVAQSRGDGRSASGDDRRGDAKPPGTSGAILGTSGDRRTFLRAWAAIALFLVVVVAVNSLTVLDDNPELDWWEPWVWEGTSALVIVAILWLPWMTYRRARPGAGIRNWRFWAVHAAGVVGFCLLHMTGFLVLREAAYALQGQDYRFGPFWGEFPYELRKDALSYAVFQSVFWLTEAVFTRKPETAEPSTFDIVDGQRVIRVPLDRIVAVTSAGNYVEFLLDDGRKPLMRAALSAVEGDLGERGFVRTHRSWLVNQARVTGLKPEGSGDWAVELGEMEVPLSRRFPQALKRLRHEA